MKNGSQQNDWRDPSSRRDGDYGCGGLAAAFLVVVLSGLFLLGQLVRAIVA